MKGPTAGGPVQLSSNHQDSYSFLQALEEIESLLGTHEVRTPTAPELYMPLTAHGEDSQHESLQNQVMTPLRPTMTISECSNFPGTVLDWNSTTLPAKTLGMLPDDIIETFSMDHKVTSFDQRKPTATSWITDMNDSPKISFIDCQKTTTTANTMAITNKDSKINTLSDEKNFYGDQMTIHGDQTHYGYQMTLSGNQTHYGGQMSITGNQTHNGGQTTISGDQTHSGGQMTISGDQTYSGGQKTFSRNQTHNGGQMTISGDQTHYGGQMTINGDQTHYGGQMTFSWDQTHYGVQAKNHSNDQTLYGVQMTALDTMTFISDQTSIESQMTTYSGDQTLYESRMVTLKRNQMTAFTNDHAIYGSHMMPCQSSSLPHPGFLYCSNSYFSQGQSLEKQNSKLKTQRCQFPKNSDTLKLFTCTYQDCGRSYSKRSHLQIHERRHTGEKPYKCKVKGCTWEFARSDELSRHNKRHSGERPYLCSLCKKNFARSDHLKQHQRVHSL